MGKLDFQYGIYEYCAEMWVYSGQDKYRDPEKGTMKLETDSLELGWGWHSNADVWPEKRSVNRSVQ